MATAFRLSRALIHNGITRSSAEVLPIKVASWANVIILSNYTKDICVEFDLDLSNMPFAVPVDDPDCRDRQIVGAWAQIVTNYGACGIRWERIAFIQNNFPFPT